MSAKDGASRSQPRAGGRADAAARLWRRSALAVGLALIACQTPTPGPTTVASILPRGCVEERAWPDMIEVWRARAEVCTNPTTEAARARCEREDYLESTCYAINAYRRELGFDPGLASFDVRFPWPALQWIDEALDLSPGHTGSESWADHLGLAGYHDNGVKRKRRAVMNVLTFGLARRWFNARGLGSPPDIDDTVPPPPPQASPTAETGAGPARPHLAGSAARSLAPPGPRLRSPAHPEQASEGSSDPARARMRRRCTRSA